MSIFFFWRFWSLPFHVIAPPFLPKPFHAFHSEIHSSDVVLQMNRHAAALHSIVDRGISGKRVADIPYLLVPLSHNLQW